MKPTFVRDPVGGGLHFYHLCHCGAWGMFGRNVSLLRAIDQKNPALAGEWRCAEHLWGRE